MLVAGSVVMAFEEVCPERIDLIHKNYRKLCNLLIDVEEWGQVVIINMLTHYARTQFLSPNQSVSVGALGCPRSLGVPWEPWFGPGGGVKKGAAGGCKASHLLLGVLTGGEHQEGFLQLRGGGCQGGGSLVGQADPDHRLLLCNTEHLLQSRNAAVSPHPQPCPSLEATGGVHQPGLVMSPPAKEPPGCLRNSQGWASPGMGFL
ncbi:AP-3 complex subunit beta-2-like isoform X1 [Strix uralensis]|uniref:AP-3 complex subunit beta-2-like isoform X1 n=1 Tax=Strix uralensis TaxID=36305 RepID=UPI003DA31A5C